MSKFEPVPNGAGYNGFTARVTEEHQALIKAGAARATIAKYATGDGVQVSPLNITVLCFLL